MNIIIKDAVKNYNGKTALSIKDLKFKEGCIYVILGLNGSGKSTLLECISGIKKLDYGSIILNSTAKDSLEIVLQSLNERKKEQKRADFYKKSKCDINQKVSIMVQKSYLFNASVLDNIVMGLKFRKYSDEKIDEILKKYLKYFDMEPLLYKNAKKLSGGEASRASILRTAVLETEVTLLDEPTASMDMENTIKAERLIMDMAKGNRSVIMVTHDIYQAKRIADIVVFMDQGEIIEMGEKDKVLNSPDNKLVRTFLNLE